MGHSMKRLLLIVILVVAGFWAFRTRLANQTTKTLTPVVQESPQTENEEDIRVVAEGLNVPWELVFLPDGSMLVTERLGQITKILPDGTKTTIFTLDEVTERGEGGLLGMVLHPDFSTNRFLYIYLTSLNDAGDLTNKVLRYSLNEGDTLSNRTVILDGISGAANHDGGRIRFGPDGYLYITTGDAQTENIAQDTDSLNGKVLRVADDGSVPEDNPFDNEVYSYGHRNPQGLAWDKAGRLWATEHGPSGVESGYDEVNLIQPGNNYGWPTVRGSQELEGLTPPVIQSGASDTWAPSGLAYLDGSLYFAGLRGSALYKATLDGAGISDLNVHFKGEYGRIRAVVVGPDGYLYITTSNRDGRGSPAQNDDRIIRINARIL